MVSALYPTEEMITAGIVSVAGRDDLPELTRDEVATIYVAMDDARASSEADFIDHLTQEIRALEEAIEELIASECRKTCVDCHGDCSGSPLGRSFYAILGRVRAEKPVEQKAVNTECNQDPRAPHGFMRDASHNAGRYVCECEGWARK